MPNRFKTMKRLRGEICRLLEERPQLQALQGEINQRLRNAGSQHNRLVVISQMMLEKFAELNGELRRLDWYVETCAPHLKSFKNRSR